MPLIKWYEKTIAYNKSSLEDWTFQNIGSTDNNDYNQNNAISFLNGIFMYLLINLIQI